MKDAIIFVEKMVSPRIKVEIPVKYKLIEDKEAVKAILDRRKKDGGAKALDRGLGGMQINSSHPLKEGLVLNLEITLPGLPVILAAVVEVLWANEKLGGLHFLEMSEEDYRVLKAYLRKASTVR